MRKFLTLTLVLLMTWACSDDDNSNNSNDLIDFKVGMLLPLTGSGSSTGEAAQAMIDNFATEFKETMAEAGYKLELVVRDTKTDPATALSLTQELYALGINVIVGPYSSASCAAIQDYTKDNGMVVISPSSVAISLADSTDNILRLATSDINQAKAMAKLLIDAGVETLYPIIREDVWGNDLSEAVIAAYKNAGGNCNEWFGYNPDASSDVIVQSAMDWLNSTIADKDQSKCGVQIIGFGESVDIINEYLYHMDPFFVAPLFGCSAMAGNENMVTDDAFARMIVDNGGYLCPVFGLPVGNEAKWGSYYNKLKQALGRAPEAYSFNVYDALDLVVQTKLELKEFTLKETTYEFPTDYFISVLREKAAVTDGLTGPLYLNEFGDRKYGNYDIWSVDDSDGFQWIIKGHYDTANDELSWE